MAPRKKELLSKNCQTCGGIFHQKRYAGGPDRYFMKRKYCCKKCAGASFRVEVDAKTRRRANVLLKYGGKCVCCGESQPEFLSLDHINNDGAAHRKEIGQSRLYKWAEDNDFPKSLQILCFNCNMAKGFYGICPHQRVELVHGGGGRCAGLNAPGASDNWSSGNK